MSTTTFDIVGIVTVEVTNHAGEIVVERTDDDAVTVAVTAIDPEASLLVDATVVESHVTPAGTTVRAIVPKGRGAFDDLKEIARDGRDEVSFFRIARRLLSGRANAVRVHVSVPDGANIAIKTTSADLDCFAPLTNVTVKSVSGDIRLHSADGDVEIASTSGDISFDECGGTCTVTSTSGNVAVTNAYGTLRATSVSGDIRIDNSHEEVNIETTSGDIASSGTRGGTFRSVSGDIRVGPVATGQVSVGTVSGDVIVEVAQGVVVDVDAESLSGELSSTIDLDDAAPGASDAALVGISVRTMSGDVLITSTTTRGARPAQRSKTNAASGVIGGVRVFQVGR